MVYLIAGKKNEGKTTRLKNLFAEKENAAGFIACKHIVCGRVNSYGLVDLNTGEEITVARLASLPIPPDWGDDFTHGPYRMSLKAFEWARTCLENAIKNGSGSFFIDELGKVEINGKGHADLIRRALAAGMDLYISIRDMNVKSAVKVFNIRDYQVIPV